MGFGTLGSIGRSTVASSPPIQYLFIDGGCLRHSILEMEKNYAAGEKLDLDFASLTAGFHKVFYYDALPSKSGDESDLAFKARHDSVAALHEATGTNCRVCSAMTNRSRPAAFAA
jgi:hypothetical protein